MVVLLETTLNTMTKKSKIVTKYVGNKFVIVKKSEVNKSQIVLPTNSFHEDNERIILTILQLKKLSEWYNQ